MYPISTRTSSTYTILYVNYISIKMNEKKVSGLRYISLRGIQEKRKAVDSHIRTRGLDRREAEMATLRSTPTLQAKPQPDVQDLGCQHLWVSCSPLFAKAHFLTSLSMGLTC